MKNKIWITKKIRIYSEKRLEKKHLLTQLIMIYYSFILVCLSIINFKSNNRTLEETIVISSFTILIISIFLSSQRFKERAIYFKNCYIQLDELYLRILNSEENDTLTEEKVEKYISTYKKILEAVENHSSFDYLCLRYSQRKNEDFKLKPLKVVDYIKYWSTLLSQYFIFSLFMLLPFIYIYIFIIN